MKVELLEALVQAQRRGRAVVLATRLENGAQRLFDPPGSAPSWGGGELGRVLREDAARVVKASRGEVFLRPYNPPAHVVVVGAVQIGQALVRVAGVAGFRCTVIDPRAAFATRERFPGVRLIRSWPAEALREIDLTPRTALVALTHDPKIDDPALECGLRSDVFYIGALGGRKSQAKRRDRLAARGFAPERQERIRGPVGLDIAARSPEEIAIAIAAEMIAELRSVRPAVAGRSPR